MIGSHSNTARVNPFLPFARLPFGSRTRKRLGRWADNALRQIKPWTMDLPARIARTWKRNPGFTTGEYSRDRWSHERQLAGHVQTWQRRRHYAAVYFLPWLVRRQAQAILGPLRRVMASGDWWQPRAYTDPETGYTTVKPYLPEDARSAAGLVHWSITKLEAIYSKALPGRRRTTPHSTAKQGFTPSEEAQGAFRDQEEAAGFFTFIRSLDRAGPGLSVVR